MNLPDFKETLTAIHPPSNTSVYLQALWYDAKGNWDKAHELIQDLDDKKAAEIHAFLHRKEGDNSNATYWYRRAARPVSFLSLQEEWDELVNAFLD